MRDFKNMKRQRGRNRGGGGGTGGGGGKPQHNANRAFDSNGPDNVKIRGHAQHVFEKYQQLARDAFSSGDRVLAENYLQHADHYFRVLRTIQPGRPPSEILGRDVLASGLDIDFEEEFEPAEEGSADAAPDSSGEFGTAGEPPRRDERNEPRRDSYDREVRRDEVRYEPRRETGEGFYRDRQDRQEPRGDYRERPVQGQERDRPDRDRQERDRPVQDRQAQHRGDNRPDRFEGRQDNRRVEGRRDERPYGQNNPQRFDDRRPEERRPEHGRLETGRAETGRPETGRPEERRPDDGRASGVDPLAVLAPEAAPPFPSASAEAQSSPVLRSEDGDMSQAPAFLQGVGGEEGDRKPRARRRRAPRSFESSEGNDAAPVEEV